MASRFFAALLLLISAIVSCLLCRKRNAWPWIVTYWLVLTAKNLIDLI